MNLDSRIYVAGHTGLVGSAIMRRLKADGYADIITKPSVQLDLRNFLAVESFFVKEKPEYVFLAAATVGGIQANMDYPGAFIRNNLQIQTNVIDNAQKFGVRKLCFLGSSCIYPRLAEQPIREESLGTGPLEPTNEPYAMAKLAGISMLKAYRQQYGFRSVCLMPTNLYGPGDSLDPQKSHLLPGLMRSADVARHTGEMVVWGTGTPRRELMHVDDLARACLHFMNEYNGDAEVVNVGTGEDMSIQSIANLVANVAKWNGPIVNDTSKPDGMPRKLLDVSKANKAGWHSEIPLAQGIKDTWDWYIRTVRH